MSKGTIAIEEAVLNPDGIEWYARTASFYAPGQDIREHILTKRVIDIHDERLARMDAAGVDYMLLSLTSPGPQAEPDAAKAASLAGAANDWLAAQVATNPMRFGALASIPMHNAEAATLELHRAVRELGMFGAILNDYQEVNGANNSTGRAYYDGPEYHPFWATVEELGVPVYLHPRYPDEADLAPGAKYAPERRHLLGAAVQFHLDLSFHVYALCSSGIFDKFPGVQVVIGHLGEG
jgi:2,3-dihydroxybenzoate decarboxylase